ncbi:MAG: thiamine phosphate synthase [Polyangiaceae bacterium]|nr:thiamine phosphate synthase [Polyangiaceae bacterium]
MAITDVARFGVEKTLQQSELLVRHSRPGAVAIQLRDHSLPARVRLEIGKDLRDLTRRYSALFIVNDRLDLAALLAADGVHLGERSFTLDAARALYSQSPSVSPASGLARGSCPFFTQAAHNVASLGPGPFAWLLSPVVEARKGRSALGFATLARAKKHLEGRCPDPRERPLVFALGGVRAGLAQACLHAGADGVAVQGAAWDGGAEALLEELAMGGRA